MQPKNILEIGTYTGYSALCLAEGLAAEGKLITIDVNAQLEDFRREYLAESPLGAQNDYRIADAMELIPQLDETFDLVFIDADKQNYINYYNLVIDKVRPGGVILADNVLYDGEVLLAHEEQSKNAKAIQAFNEKIRADKRVIQVLLPIRDGLLLMKKISD